MSNYNGFTLIEVLVSLSIIMMLITTMIPISSLLEQERMVLSERRTFSAKLHDELQPFLWNDVTLPAVYSMYMELVEVKFDFRAEGKLIKGCVVWENARQKNERICLYGIR